MEEALDLLLSINLGIQQLNRAVGTIAITTVQIKDAARRRDDSPDIPSILDESLGGIYGPYEAQRGQSDISDVW